MKHFVTCVMITLLLPLAAKAQQFTDHLQKKVQGEGTVTISQSKDIDELVNGKKKQTTTNFSRPTEKERNIKKDYQDHTRADKSREDKELPAKKENRKESRQANVDAGENFDIPVIDMRKKVMRNSYRVVGYRVQAFAGGNSRQDRLAAQKAGNAIKMKYPDQPIYVHFYSPRWICRVGNFRTLGEANKMLRQVRAMGYKSASLVKGEITVQK